MEDTREMFSPETLSRDSEWGKKCLGMYILVFIQGIAWISGIEKFRLSSLTLAVAGADFLRPPSLKVAGRVSSMKIVA